jgi:hypothetical protein
VKVRLPALEYLPREDMLNIVNALKGVFAGNDLEFSDGCFPFLSGLVKPALSVFV